MKIKSIGGRVGLWCAFLAAGTWILPMGIFLSPTSARASLVEGDSVSPEIISLHNAAQDWISAGGLDLPAYCEHSLDLDHDGIADTVFVDPGTFLGSDGRVAVIDGATNSVRFELFCPVGETLFGESVAVASDISFDGVDDLLVASMTKNVTSEAAVRCHARGYSGADGKLLGLLSKLRQPTQSAGPPEVVSSNFIGDVNRDGSLDAHDVTGAITELGSPEERLPAADMDSDGTISLSDVVTILERALSADAPMWSELHGSLADIDAVYVPIPPVVEGFTTSSAARELFADLPPTPSVQTTIPAPAPPALVATNCWLDALWITAQFASAITMFVGCGAITASPMAPAAVWCWVSTVCNLYSVIVQFISFIVNCVAGAGNPTANTWLDLLENLFNICALVSGGGITSLKPDDYKKSFEAIREFYKHLRTWG